MNLKRIQALKHELETAFEQTIPPVVLLETCASSHPENAFLRSLRDLPVRQIDRVMAIQNATVLGQAIRGRALAAGATAILAHAEDRPLPRMAVGYALSEKGKYELEVRLQNPDVQSFLFARQLVAERSDVPARVGVLRNLVAHAAHPAALNNKPLTLGSSVGLAKGGAGSLGGFVRQGEMIGILSCSHVLARAGRAAANDPIYHPSPKDDALANGEIAKLQRFVNLADRKPRYQADMAFGWLAAGHKAGVTNVVPKGHDWPSEGRALAEIRRDPLVKFTAVAKIGRTSGWTTGRFLHENQGPVDVFMPDLGRSVALEGLIEIEWTGLDDPFSAKGDSGSLVYLAETLEPIGLLVGGGEVDITENGVKRTHGASYACPVGTILREWKLSLLQ